MIKGGYYLKARCIQNSEIACAPPHIREIWDWLLKEANHTDKKVSGIIIKRGQCLRLYQDIQEGLHWKIGWRKMTYTKHHIETTMKLLKKKGMITTKKTTRGMIITICKYDYYQTKENYENHNENHSKTTPREPQREPQTSDTINKNEKNKEKNKEKNADSDPRFRPLINFFSLTVSSLKNFKPKIGKADTGLLKQRLSEGMQADEIQNCITYYLNSEKAKNNGVTLRACLSDHSINLFREHWEKSKGLYA